MKAGKHTMLNVSSMSGESDRSVLNYSSLSSLSAASSSLQPPSYHKTSLSQILQQNNHQNNYSNNNNNTLLTGNVGNVNRFYDRQNIHSNASTPSSLSSYGHNNGSNSTTGGGVGGNVTLNQVKKDFETLKSSIKELENKLFIIDRNYTHFEDVKDLEQYIHSVRHDEIY